jgi:Zn-dependent protease
LVNAMDHRQSTLVQPAEAPWSVPFGVWGGAPVRLHLSLVSALVIGGWWAFEGQSSELAAALAIWVASLVVHEGAHALAALRVGGSVDGVILSPLGGLRSPRLPDDPESRVFVAMAGPMANLLLVVAGAICLAGYDQTGPGLASLFFPQFDTLLSGEALAGGGAEVDVAVPGAVATAFATTFAKLLVWVNWPLFALNLLPSSPFDGGRALASLLAPWTGNFFATRAVARFAVVAGALAAIAGLLLETDPQGAPPVDLTLALVGLLVAFGGVYDLNAVEPSSDVLLLRGRHASGARDEADDWWSEDGEDAVVLVEATRAADEQGARRTPPEVDDALEERRLDAVLAKLHLGGLEGLSADERAVLDRASQRLRSRRGAG